MFGRKSKSVAMQSLRITIIQTDLHWENPDANRKMLEQKIRSLNQPGHIVLLPEMFTSGFSMRPELVAEEIDGPTYQWMKALASEKRLVLCGSLAVKENSESDSTRPLRYFNRLIWMLPNGHYGTYDKRHLFAYAGEDKHYTSGNRRLIASVNGWRINLQICYDLRFPVWARQSISPEDRQAGKTEYDVLVYLANWPERRIQAWRSLLIARAIENQTYVIGVNRVGDDGNGIYHSGNSMVIDPFGEVLYEKEKEEDEFTTELSYEHLLDVRSRLPFLKDGDDFSLFV
jgi:predicted amidohydrolase